MIHVDFTQPATIKRLAELPYYGWAEAMVRRVDPLWKALGSEPIRFKVWLERGDDGCPRCEGHCCGEEGDFQRKSIEVEAMNHDDAKEVALSEMLRTTNQLDWEAEEVEPLVPTATVPVAFLKWFDDGREGFAP